MILNIQMFCFVCVVVFKIMFRLIRVVMFIIFRLIYNVMFCSIYSSFLVHLILFSIFAFIISKFEKFRFVNRVVVLSTFVIIFFLFYEFRNLFFDFIIIDLSIFDKFLNSNIFENIFDVDNNIKRLFVYIIFRNVKLLNSKFSKKNFDIKRSMRLFLLCNKF